MLLELFGKFEASSGLDLASRFRLDSPKSLRATAKDRTDLAAVGFNEMRFQCTVVSKMVTVSAVVSISFYYLFRVRNELVCKYLRYVIMCRLIY